MNNKQNPEQKVRKSTYYDIKTEQLLSQKSQELGMSKNQISELCLQRFLPEMQSTWSWKFPIESTSEECHFVTINKMDSSPEETLEMSLREHFVCLVLRSGELSLGLLEGLSWREKDDLLNKQSESYLVPDLCSWEVFDAEIEDFLIREGSYNCNSKDTKKEENGNCKDVFD